MFTGIITDIATIKSVSGTGDIRLEVVTSYNTDDIAIGASIACSGVCLTVVEKAKGLLYFDVSAETLSCTNAVYWKEGTRINLERALKVGDELGGHIVSGHVDGLAEVLGIEPVDDSLKITLRAPDELKIFIAAKGSVTLDGVSLTVNEVKNAKFSVNIIPHTQKETICRDYKPGTKVNLEVDLMARYAGRLLKFK